MPASPPSQKPKKKRTGLVIGVSAGAVVVVLALVAALVLPRVLANDDFQTAPSMATSPQLVNSWTNRGDSGLAGLPGLFHASDTGLMLMGTTHGESYWMESLETGRSLWTTSRAGLCRLGTKGVLTCVDVSDMHLTRQVTLLNLRSGERLRQFSLPAEPVEFHPLPDGGLIMAVSSSGRQTRWIRVDEEGREQWQSTLPTGSWSGITPHGAAVVAAQWDTTGKREIGIVRSLATGEPLPGVPDSVPVALLPGGEIQVGANPALVLNKDGQGKLNLPGSTTANLRLAAPLLNQTSFDGSVLAYETTVNDVPTIWNDKGDMVARSHQLAAVCKGTILTTRDGATAGSPRRLERIGFDSRGEEVMRVDLPWNQSFYPGCDGQRFVETTADRSGGVILGYDRSGLSWETPVAGEFGYVTSDGVLIADHSEGLYLYR